MKVFLEIYINLMNDYWKNNDFATFSSFAAIRDSTAFFIFCTSISKNTIQFSKSI